MSIFFDYKKGSLLRSGFMQRIRRMTLQDKKGIKDAKKVLKDKNYQEYIG